MGWVLAAVFVALALGNLGIALRWYTRGKSASLVPLVGRLAGMAACFTLPFPALAYWWWMPLFADLGAAFLLGSTAVLVIRRTYNRS